MTVIIRLADANDQAAIRAVHTLAFKQDGEAKLVDSLRSEGCVQLSLVAVAGEKVVGHILFSDLQIVNGNTTVRALALAPLAVVPEFQAQGIGSALVREGLGQCAKQGHQIVLVLGSPEYYERFGFLASLARPLASPYAGEHFMALELVRGALHGVSSEVVYARPFSNL